MRSRSRLSVLQRRIVLVISEKLLEYIEETRSCIRQLEERPRVSRTESVSAGSLSTISVSNMSFEVSSQKDIYSIQSVDSRYQDWEDMDLEVKVFFYFCCFFYKRECDGSFKRKKSDCII